MMRSRQIVLLLIVIGVACLPAPLYLSWIAQSTAPPPQTSQIYLAKPLHPTNTSDQQFIVTHHASTVALSIHQVSHRYSAGEYQAPNVTHRTLATAMETGSVATNDTRAQADLRVIEQNYTFVYDAYASDEQYYRLRVSKHGSVVRAHPVSTATVVNETIDRTAVYYDNLSTGEQRTVDRILANSSAHDSGYRPRVDDPFTDQLPVLIYKNGTLYSLFVYGHVDDFGPGFSGFIVGLAMAAIGAVLLLAGATIYVVTWRRAQNRT